MSVAGNLDVAPDKATIHWAAIEFDDNVLAAMGGAAGREFTRPFVGSTLAFVTETE